MLRLCDGKDNNRPILDSFLKAGGAEVHCQII